MKKKGIKSEEVFLFGLRRSGSTKVKNILGDIFSEEVERSHTFKKVKKKYIFCTYRDFRDIVFSMWRISYAEYDEEGNLLNLPSRDIIKKIGEKIKKWVKEDLNRIKENFPEIVWIKYEDYWNKNDKLLGLILSILEINLDQKVKKGILTNNSLKTNKNISKKLKTFKKYDKNLIHGDHIRFPKPGAWKKLTSENKEFLTNLLFDELKEWGYL